MIQQFNRLLVGLFAAAQSAKADHGATDSEAAEQSNCAWLRNCGLKRTERERIGTDKCGHVGERAATSADERQAGNKSGLETSAV